MSGERDGGTFGFVAATAVGAVSAGLMVITATVIAVDALRSSDPNLNPALYLLFGGTLAGLLVAGATAWWLLEPIQSTYRRGGLALVAGFSTAMVMLICIPIHQLLGRAGLAGFLILCAGTALLAGRRARRRVARA